jgi:filamentous hemagglutinin
MIAGGDLTVTASKDTATHHEQSMGGKNAQHIGSSYDESVNGGGLTPMLSQSDSGSSDATTRSAISAGSINIADKDQHCGQGSSDARHCESEPGHHRRKWHGVEAA